MKKLIVLGLILLASLSLVVLPVASAWQMSPTNNDWWFINANGGWVGIVPFSVPLEIKLNGDQSAGQMFLVGDIITITVDLNSEAASTAGSGNEAYLEWLLEVTGPSGPNSETDFLYDFSDSEAYVGADMTLTISYTVTDVGIHTVYVNSNAQISQYWGAGAVEEEIFDAELTFEVLAKNKAGILRVNGVPGKGIANAPGLQKLPPNDNFAKGTAK